MELYSTLHRIVHQSDDGPIKRRIVDESGPYSRAGEALNRVNKVPYISSIL